MPTTWDGTPKTWSTGELVTAALLNTELRDRMEYLEALLVVNGYVRIEEQQASGTDGGTFTSGSWQTRVLNTEVSDTGNLASLSSNQITLAAGTYVARIACPANKVNAHQARLQNITDGTTLLLGQNAFAVSTTGMVTLATIVGKFTLASSKVLEVQHRAQTTAGTNGYGAATSWGTEVYTQVELIRIGD